MELAARRRRHPQPGTAALLRHGAAFPLAATNMPPPTGLGRCVSRFKITSSGLQIPVTRSVITISDLKIPVTRFVITISDLKIPVTGFEITISDLEIPVTKFVITISDLEIPVTRFVITISDLEIVISSRRQDRELSDLMTGPPGRPPGPVPAKNRVRRGRGRKNLPSASASTRVNTIINFDK